MKLESVNLRGRSQFPWADNRGSLLVVALWVLSVLGIFALSIGYQVRQKVTLAERLDRRGLLFGIAEAAGVGRALVEVVKEDTTPDHDLLKDSWSSDEKLFREASFEDAGSSTVSHDYLDYKDSSEGELKTRFGSQDEESKINLNTVDPETLIRLLREVADLAEDEAKMAAYSVMDWRDTDSFVNQSLYGAEDDYYDELDPPYEAKDAPFEVLQELLLVRGMDPEIFERIKDKITVYGDGAVNINTASKEVLLALGLNEKAAETILTYRRGLDKEEATEDDRAFTQVGSISTELGKVGSLSVVEQSAITNLVAAGRLTTQSKHFRVQSKAEARGTAIDVTAVLNREGKVLFLSAGIPRRIRIVSTTNAEAESGPLPVLTS